MAASHFQSARRSAAKLREDALAIWRAGVAAVDSERLVREQLRVEDGRLSFGEPGDFEPIDLAAIKRIAIVGAGKAGAGMAAGALAALGERVCREKSVSGWINVPSDCVRSLDRVHLHGARPPGANEPTEAAAQGAEEILRMVGEMEASDLCLCLISGGGSALLPAPAEGITLADKLAITRFLSASGANIAELNTVRKRLSRIKGGGLARACRAGRLVTLVISDVLGDPLETIASGPTVESRGTAAEALAVLERFGGLDVAPRATALLQSPGSKGPDEATRGRRRVTNIVIGNNARAVDAAGIEAERRGYSHAMDSAQSQEPTAEEVGRSLATMALRMRSERGPDCLITGGEPVVRLAPAAVRGLGGRNQQLVLAACEDLQRRGETAEGLVLLSGGTDGEDGPTDAAGAMLDEEVFRAAAERQVSPQDYLDRNDAYHFFEPLGGLIRTGPTHTNVCDLRVVVVDRMEPQGQVG